MFTGVLDGWIMPASERLLVFKKNAVLETVKITILFTEF